jgi:DNA repair/transcription protein MET18/MMS19
VSCIGVTLSASTAPFAVSQALPQIFRQFNRPALPSHRAPLISTLSALLLAARSVYAVEGTNRSEEQEKAFGRYRESILDVLREGLRTDGLKGPAVRGSVSMIEVPGLLDRGEVEDLVKGMDDVLVNEQEQDLR